MEFENASLWLVGYFAAINAVVVVLAVIDRVQAARDGVRVSEQLLLTLSLLGGAAGAKLVQMVTRHKTLKFDYTAALSLIAIFQLALAGGLWTALNSDVERVTLAQILSGAPDEEEDAEAVPPDPQTIRLDSEVVDEGWTPFGG